MTNAEHDDAFAHQANRLGMVTLDQVDEARLLQEEISSGSSPISLADALIQSGAITPVQKENVLKQLEARKTGGIKQLGQYKLLKKLGQGGMGAVYLSEDTLMQRKVAIKILPKKFADDAQFLSRFRREAKAAGNLNHVNICGAFSVGEEQGHHYYVMEYLPGQSLGEKINSENLIECDEAVQIVIQATRGLQYSHKHGFIHRDIKPDNIFLTDEGIAKILDMGLTKNILGGEETTALTQTGMAVGTPNYISPEQARGDRDIDGRTDIYSLGATFYHMITGMVPFQASNAAAIILKHLNEQVPNPQDANMDIPDGVVHIITRMMAKEPDDRYADCGELLEDLELVVDGQDPSSQMLEAEKSSVAQAKVRGGEPRRGRRATGARDAVRRRRATSANEGVPRRRTKGQRVPAEPRDEEHGEDRLSPPASDRLPLYIGGGVAAAILMVVAWFLVFSGKPEPATAKKSPTSEAAKKDPEAVRESDEPSTSAPGVTEPNVVEDGWEMKFRKIQTFAAEHPTKFDEIIQKYREFLGRVRRNPARPRFEDRVLLEIESVKKRLLASSEVALPGTGAGTSKSLADPRELARALFAKGRRPTDEELKRLTAMPPPPEPRRVDYSVLFARHGMHGWNGDYGSKADIAVVAGEQALRVQQGKGRHACYRTFDVFANRTRVRMRIYQKGIQKTQLCVQTNSSARCNVAFTLPPPEKWTEVRVALGEAEAKGVKLSNIPIRHIEIHGFPVKEGQGFFAISSFQIISGMPAAASQVEYAKRQGLPKETSLDLGNGVAMQFVLVPPGTFMMGYSGIQRAKPVHRVTLTKPFYLGKYEVTQAQHKRVMKKISRKTTNPNLPATSVSWDGCRTFCQKMTAMTEQAVRLPTEAEWEYACRAGTDTRYSFGDLEGELAHYAWFRGNAGGGIQRKGQKKHNAFGLYDMHGNAAEWCADVFSTYTNKALSDPVGPKQGDQMVVRGGSWKSAAFQCSSASRDIKSRGTMLPSLGFRVAMDVSQAMRGQKGAGATTDRSSDASLATGLVGHWRFDDGMGATASDSSGMGKRGKLVGGPVWVEEGKDGGALRFDGKDDYVEVPYDPLFELPNGGAAIALWLKVDPTVKLGQTTTMGVLRRYSHSNGMAAGNYELSLRQQGPTDPPALRVLVGNPRGHDVVKDAKAFSLGKWHHVAFVWNSTSLLLYVDGRRVVIRPRKAEVTYLPRLPLELGRSNGCHLRYFMGIMDDVRIYSRALRAEEVKALFDLGTSAPGISADVLRATAQGRASGRVDRYTIRKKLGSGRKGSAYVVYDEETRKEVCLKVGPVAGLNATDRDRFKERERSGEILRFDIIGDWYVLVEPVEGGGSR